MVGDVHIKVSIHTASHIDTQLAVARFRDRDRVRVRVRVLFCTVPSREVGHQPGL